MNLGQERSWKTLLSAHYLCSYMNDTSSLLLDILTSCEPLVPVPFMGVSGAQNRSELKWERTNRVDFQVTSFTVSEPKIEQETLFSILTWKIQNPLGWVCGMGLFGVCCLSWNIYCSEWPKFIFSTWKKIPPGRQNVLAPYWAWKINTVSPQEIRGGLD